MPKRSILILDQEESPWPSFLEEFFSDTKAEICFFQKPAEAHAALNRSPKDLVFIKDPFLSPPLAQKLKAHRQSNPHFRIFELASGPPSPKLLAYDFSFTEPLIFLDFQRKLGNHLPLPDPVRVLIVDDEVEIGGALRDFLVSQPHGRFHAEYVDNGEKGLRFLEKEKPDALVMDVKMPVMDGRQLYKKIQERGWKFPVIVHFDAIFGDEVMEIHKIGKPAIVEKGSHESSLPDMMALIQKMVYCG